MHDEDVKPDTFELVDEPAEGVGGVGAREDIFVHEETPDEVFELPVGADAGDLEDQDAIVVDLGAEGKSNGGFRRMKLTSWKRYKSRGRN
jgi:hypothetical protein